MPSDDGADNIPMEESEDRLEKITRALLREFRELELERAGQANKATQKEKIRKKLENEDF